MPSSSAFREKTKGVSSSKGQWFLVSAVLATGAFLAISFLFRTYFASDSSIVARTSEDFYFSNLRDQLDYLAARNCPAGDFYGDFSELKEASNRILSALGYAVRMDVVSFDCAQNPAYKLKLLVASSRFVVCQNYDQAEVSSVIGPKGNEFNCFTT